MWNLCRPAALARLQHVALHAPMLRASSAALQSIAAARGFSSNTPPPVTVAGVELRHLIESSPQQLRAELGKDKIAKVNRALTEQFQKAVSNEDDVTSDDIADLFTAAQKTRLQPLMLRAFAHMQQHFPDDIDFIMYGEVFRVLSKERDGAKLWAIYEFARPRFEPAVPELIYRFGIVGKIELGELDAAYALIETMQNDGHFVTNEIYSRLLSGFARSPEYHDRLLEIYERLDPSSGTWHESAIDRVILSLGVARKPELAFEFYVHSNMKLNGGTLITLLSVCRHNDCRQQAADILENRKRFDLSLDARGYNAILQTLEFLDRHDDLEAVLDEMNDNGVRFDTRTKEIVARNQPSLKGSYYDLALAHDRSASGSPLASSNATKKKKSKRNDPSDKMTAYNAMPEITALIENKQFDEAAALVDTFIRELTRDDVPEDRRETAVIAEGALRVPPSIAKQALQAYIGTNDLAKIDNLLKGFEHTDARVGHALMEIFLAFSEEDKRGKQRTRKLSRKQNRLAYRAAKIMGQQGWQIYKTTQALQLFRQFGDGDAARQMCERLLLEYVGKANGQNIQAGKASEALVLTLRTFAETNDLPSALALLDRAQEIGFRIEPAHYVGLLTGMRENSPHIAKTKGRVVLSDEHRSMPFFYTTTDFVAVLDSMRARGVRMTRAVVANLCFPLAAGTVMHRTKLLEVYAEAAARSHSKQVATVRDSFTIPTVVYSALMHTSARQNPDLVELRQIYEDALASLPVNADDGSKRVPIDWEIIMISHLADGGFVDEATERLQNMHATCGAYSYEALVKVLRGGLAGQNKAAIKTALALVDERQFRFTLNDAYDFVHLARDADLPDVAFEVVTQYERAHGSVTETANHAQLREKYAVRKLRTMCRVVLTLCEHHGQWKRALEFSQREKALLALEESETDDNDDHDDATEQVSEETKQGSENDEAKKQDDDKR